MNKDNSTETRQINILRHFVLCCNEGPLSDSDILLQDLKKCRVDLMARCINSALFNSRCIRNNTKISFFCGNNDQNRVITFDGEYCKHLKPDERTLGAMIKHCLHHGPLTLEQKHKLFQQYPKTKVLKGMDVITNSNSFCGFIQYLITLYNQPIFIIHLTENGQDINIWLKKHKQSILDNSRFITLLGDNKDIASEYINEIKNHCSKYNEIHFIDIKIGNISLLASHTIVLFHHYIDSFCANRMKC